MLIDSTYSKGVGNEQSHPQTTVRLKSHRKLFKHHRGGSNLTEEERQQEAIKRRTIQNRIAQRLYRQRKDNRITELEAQVAELLAKQEQDREHRHQSNFDAVQVEILEKRVKDLEAENAKLKATVSSETKNPLYLQHIYKVGNTFLHMLRPNQLKDTRILQLTFKPHNYHPLTRV
ncbi:hypothetical protein HDU99_010529 [Rhizoclosmatium hyalinum]|nr:hypothetical protein HDU99_010529 [Rhizoclosmatium hyalinum]